MLMHPATRSAWLTGLVRRFSPIFGTHPDPTGAVRVCDSQRRLAEQGGKQDFASLMKQVLPPKKDSEESPVPPSRLQFKKSSRQL